MQMPMIFDFKRKTVTAATDPSVHEKLREVLASRSAVKMTGSGVPKIEKPT